MTENKKTSTHFGFQKVTPEEKTTRVNDVFSSVVNKYDIMNDLASFGLHRLWKSMAMSLFAVRPGQRVLDLAGGSGDMAIRIAPLIGDGELVVADRNMAMLTLGRNRLLDAGFARVQWVCAAAEDLPFADDSFDRVCIAFGLRNFTHKEKSLAEIKRILRPQGKLMILEFSRPISPVLSKLYDIYSFTWLPLLGEIIAHDSDSYRYLAESIRQHPDQQTLLAAMQESGIVGCYYENISGGIVAIHIGNHP